MWLPFLGQPNVEKLRRKRNVRALRRALFHRDSLVRRMAVKSLAEVGDGSAIGDLIKAIRVGCVSASSGHQALGQCLGRSRTKNELLGYIQGDDSLYRQAAVRALGVHWEEKFEPLLRQLVSDPDQYVSKAAASVLAQRQGSRSKTKTRSGDTRPGPQRREKTSLLNAQLWGDELVACGGLWFEYLLRPFESALRLPALGGSAKFLARGERLTSEAVYAGFVKRSRDDLPWKIRVVRILTTSRRRFAVQYEANATRSAVSELISMIGDGDPAAQCAALLALAATDDVRARRQAEEAKSGLGSEIEAAIGEVLCSRSATKTC